MKPIRLDILQIPRPGIRPLTQLALFLASALLVAGALPARAQEARCEDHDPLRQPFFGDLHVHSSFSMDTLIFLGNPDGDPAAAYRFARGEPIGYPPFGDDGRPAAQVRLERPLDFAAVTDHAEFLGEVRICLTPEHPGYDSEPCRLMRGGDQRLGFFTWFRPMMRPADAEMDRFPLCDVPADEGTGGDGGDGECLEIAASVWEETRRAAVAADDATSACRFTSFVGYEWTGFTGGANLHRNVIFGTTEVPRLPISYLDEPRVEAFHRALEDSCQDAEIDCDALVIPHNSNFSQGRMFLPRTSDGAPLSASEARRRARLERLVEIVQHKGTSECRSGVGTTDELCDFETLDSTSLIPVPEQPPQEPLSYARNGLMEGLEQEASLGTNPFRFGFVGGTDSHNAAAGDVEEWDYRGHLGGLDATLPGRLFQVFNNPGGLTVIWAEENSRASLFAALKRREVYATSGTRPLLRVFAGFDLPPLCDEPDFVRRGYDLGVPMGGELELPAEARENEPPHLRLAVSAWKDPGTADHPGSDLDRVQVVKGWLDAEDRVHETVYEVGPEKEGEDGVKRLCATWTDPDFDPTEPAFYYVRLLETPTLRWHARQCDRAGVQCDDLGNVPQPLRTCCDPKMPRTLQERAWSSPVWYSPSAPKAAPKAD